MCVGQWLFPPPQNIRAPAHARGGHASCHDAAFVGRISHVGGKITIRVVGYGVRCPWGNVLMRQMVQVLLVWVDHVTIEIRLSDDIVVRVVYVHVMVQRITARDCGDGDSNRDWMRGVVWGGEHSLVDVI